MRTHNLIVAGCLSLLVFSGCNSENKEQANTETNPETVSTEQKSNTMQAGTVSKEQLEGMLSAYFDIKNALVDTNSQSAKSATDKLLVHIGEGMQSIKEAAENIKSRETIEQIRTDFEVLSQDMYNVVKNNPEVKEEVVYKQYCPMAFDNKGAFWLSNQEEIKNPYFGSKMLKCGKVQETL